MSITIIALGTYIKHKIMTQMSQQAIVLYLNVFYSALQTDAKSPL